MSIIWIVCQILNSTIIKAFCFICSDCNIDIHLPTSNRSKFNLSDDFLYISHIFRCIINECPSFISECLDFNICCIIHSRRSVFTGNRHRINWLRSCICDNRLRKCKLCMCNICPYRSSKLYRIIACCICINCNSTISRKCLCVCGLFHRNYTYRSAETNDIHIFIRYFWCFFLLNVDFAYISIFEICRRCILVSIFRYTRFIFFFHSICCISKFFLTLLSFCRFLWLRFSIIRLLNARCI